MREIVRLRIFLPRILLGMCLAVFQGGECQSQLAFPAPMRSTLLEAQTVVTFGGRTAVGDAISSVDLAAIEVEGIC